jgi:hypothetical protein
MAARDGHLELCRFLLRETSLSADNAVLSSALDEFLKHAWHVGSKVQDALMEAFYRLFAGEYNMHIDILDWHDSLANPSIYQLVHTKTSFGVLLASQPTPFADLPFEERFAAAIEAVGWPAEVFAETLHHHDPTEVATRTTKYGKTALHWAAAHLGHWLRINWVDDFYPYKSRKIESYAKLTSSLLRMGADVHALCQKDFSSSSGVQTVKGFDPFLLLFQGITLGVGYPWGRHVMAKAVNVWGQVLIEGGVHLSDYIIAENEVLRSIEWFHRSSSDVNDGRLVPVKLLMTGKSTLAVEILEIHCITVWKAQAVPGAWPALPLIVDTIIWTPDTMDECNGFYWIASESVTVNTTLGHSRIDAPSMCGESDELLCDSIVDAVRGRSETTITIQWQSFWAGTRVSTSE